MDFTKNLEPMILMMLASVAGLAQDQAEKLGKRLGDQLNDAIEGSETSFDDYAKQNVLIPFLEAVLEELRVEGVDEENTPTEA